MRVLLQRVTRASVSVDGETLGEIGEGLLLLVGVTTGDNDGTVNAVAEKVVNLRIFEDASGAMNRSALDLRNGGEDVGLLVVSQFTLYAETRKGRRPSFIGAARPEVAAPIIEAFAERLRDGGLTVAQGRCGARMAVELVNDGPVTIWLDSADLRRA